MILFYLNIKNLYLIFGLNLFYYNFHKVKKVLILIRQHLNP